MTKKTGREFPQAIIDGEHPPAPSQYTLGFRLSATGDGMASRVAGLGASGGEHRE